MSVSPDQTGNADGPGRVSKFLMELFAKIEKLELVDEFFLWVIPPLADESPSVLKLILMQILSFRLATIVVKTVLNQSHFRRFSKSKECLNPWFEHYLETPKSSVQVLK